MEMIDIYDELHDVFFYRKNILLEEYSFYDNEVKEVSYVSLEKFKIMVETHSTMLMPYKTHYIFFTNSLR